MAWNEPGNNSGNNGGDRHGGRKDKDPWSQSNQGPPDLDEALEKLKAQFSSIFGGGSGKGSGGSSSKGSGGQFPKSIVMFALLAVTAFWGFSGFYQVDQKERVVILRLGQYHDTVGPGLHWNPLFIDQRFSVLVTQEQDYRVRGLMLTEDENIVEVPISVQYTIPDPKKFILQVRDPITSLHHATDSAIRHVVGGTQSSDVLSQGRQAMAEETKVRLQSYLDSYDTGINITLVNILKAEPPKAVKPAFDDVISAKEDKDRYVNEAKTYANGLVPEARGKAERIMQEAIGYREKLIAEADGEAQRFVKLYNEYRKAPEVTRERLYLDSVEGVMSNVSKVLIDVEGGNNMMYLPLDKMVSQPKSALPESTASGQNDIVSQVTNQVIDRLRQEQSRARRSEAR